MPPVMRTRGARFQQWQALLTHRNKRHRLGLFLVHGVRPVTLAVEHGWPLVALLVRCDGPPLSAWARELTERAVADGVEHVPMTGELLADLAERDDAAPEVVAVAATRQESLNALVPTRGLVLALDRPSSPGNLGTLVRSADALGADAVVVGGHAADPYDPQAVRASTGSLFALPVVMVEGPEVVVAWARRRGARVVGTDESGSLDVHRADLRAPVVLVVGNETRGLSEAWRAACDDVVAVPLGGAASSLNAAVAGSLVLYEAARQRGFPYRG